MIKFSEMKYERPDMENLKPELLRLTQKLKKADSYKSAKEVFLEKENFQKHLITMRNLASIRHSIDTRDNFYDDEMKFWNTAGPEIEEYLQKWMMAMLESPYRSDFSTEYGDLMFLRAEMFLKTFSPEIISLLKEDNDLVQEYEKLLASADIPFEGGRYTLSQLTPFKGDLDDDIRLSAWKAEGKWYKDHQDQFDLIYDKLVHIRDEMGKKMGYESYTTLGYYRMGRIGYTRKDVEQFRENVIKYVVPVAEEIYQRQAERLGKKYPMSFADNELSFRTGNPRPVGSPKEILNNGKKFYEELSPKTGVFFNTMLNNELLDVLSTEGKQAGGYCTFIPDYKVPFIFANFNGTQGDVEVVTHEAGHAFEVWVNRDRVPMEYVTPSMEGAEVHSMSMEFFAEPWARLFFGDDADKFLYSHLAHAISFIPYGCLVDHFQHEVYDKADMTPAKRHAVWKKLMGVYMPWMLLDGDIPFYGEGESWQQKHHIYSFPFYYIDYCLAQTVSLEFWALIQNDLKDAWDHYMAFTSQGGSRAFTDLIKNAGLESPFEEKCLENVCKKAAVYLRSFKL